MAFSRRVLHEHLREEESISDDYAMTKHVFHPKTGAGTISALDEKVAVDYLLNKGSMRINSIRFNPEVHSCISKAGILSAHGQSGVAHRLLKTAQSKSARIEVTDHILLEILNGIKERTVYSSVEIVLAGRDRLRRI